MTGGDGSHDTARRHIGGGTDSGSGGGNHHHSGGGGGGSGNGSGNTSGGGGGGSSVSNGLGLGATPAGIRASRTQLLTSGTGQKVKSGLSGGHGHGNNNRIIRHSYSAGGGGRRDRDNQGQSGDASPIDSTHFGGNSLDEGRHNLQLRHAWSEERQTTFTLPPIGKG